MNVTRRKALQLAMLAPLMPASTFAMEPRQELPSATQQPQAMDHDMTKMSPAMQKVPWMGDEQIAMLMYPGMAVLDLIGPQSMFASMMGAKIVLVAKTMKPVTSDAGGHDHAACDVRDLPARSDGLVCSGWDGRDAGSCGRSCNPYLPRRSWLARKIRDQRLLGFAHPWSCRFVEGLQGHLALVRASGAREVRRDCNRRTRGPRPQSHHGRGRDGRARHGDSRWWRSFVTSSTQNARSL